MLLHVQGRGWTWAFGIAASLPATITALRVRPTWVPSGDTALVALRSLDVSRGHLPLAGMPTTLGSVVERQLYHPGPSEFFLLATPLRAFGPSALVACMVALYATCAFGATLAANRLGGLRSAAIASLFLAATLASVPQTVLIDVLNPHFGFPPLILFIAAVCVLVEHADQRWLPVAVVAGSIAAQSHVALAAIVAGVTLAALLLSRSGARAERQRNLRRTWQAVAAALGALLWLPVAINEARTGNILGLLAGGSEDARRIPTSYVMNGVTNAVTTPSWASSMDAFAYVRDPSAWANVLAALIFLGVLAAAVYRGGPHPHRTAARVALATIAAGMVTQTRMPDTFFAVAALHNYLWLWVASGFAMTIVATAASSVVPQRWVSTSVVFALLGVSGFAATRAVDVSPPWIAAVTEARRPLLERTGPDDRTLVVVRPDLRGYGITAGLAFALEDAGRQALVPAVHGPSFGPHRSWSAADKVTQVILVNESSDRPRVGAELLATAPEPDGGPTSYVWLLRSEEIQFSSGFDDR